MTVSPALARTAAPAPTAAPVMNRAAVAALAIGAVALPTSFVAVGGVLGLAGLILGVVALAAASRTGIGRGPALAAVVVSAVSVVISVVVVLLAVWFAYRTQACYPINDPTPWFECVRDTVGR